MKLPVHYPSCNWKLRQSVREAYIDIQNGNCFWCGEPLKSEPPESITSKKINWKLFPKHFMDHSIHLQHDHVTGMTEGAVHAYCNAVMWQYHGR